MTDIYIHMDDYVRAHQLIVVVVEHGRVSRAQAQLLRDPRELLVLQLAGGLRRVKEVPTQPCMRASICR